MLGFGTAVSICFRKYATFSGRAQRSEYWWFALFNLLVSLVLGLVDGSEVLDAIYSLLVLLPSLAVTARRLHDVDRSGWWMVAPYGLAVIAMLSAAGNLMIFAWVAGIGAVVTVLVLLVWTIRIGAAGANRFGPDPLEPGGAGAGRG